MQKEEAAHDWTVLAHLLRPQGRRGELLAELLTDFPERFAAHPEVQLATPVPGGTHRLVRSAVIVNHWLPTGRNQGRVVFALQGVESIDAAQALAGLDVVVEPDERVPLDQGAEYISDLEGCALYDRGSLVGTVTGVDFATTADGTRRLLDAAPLLTVEAPNGDEVLVPYVQQFLLSVSIAAKRIEMTLPEGLLDLNRGPATAPPGRGDQQE